MIVTIPSIILSIIHTGDKKYVLNKLNSLKADVVLNAVEFKIIEVIEENLEKSVLVSTSYIKEAFSYVYNDDVNAQFNKYLSKEAIDGAISTTNIKQGKAKLASELSKISGSIEKSSIAEIKDMLDKINQTELVEDNDEIPNNGFREEEDAYKVMQENKGEFTLLIPEVEAHAGLAARGTITTILGFIGSYKSTYAANVATANALRGFNVLYLALENTEKRIFSNAVINYTASNTHRRGDMIEMIGIRDGKLTDAQQEIYNKKHNELNKKVKDHLLIWDTAKFRYNNFSDMTRTLRKADKFFKKKNGKGIDCIFFDQVSLLRETSGNGRKASYDGAIINAWMIYFNTQSLNFLDEGRKIAIFPVSQVGREKWAAASKKKNKGRYGADCASDANEIERISTTMITLYVDPDTRNTLLIAIPKARLGYVTDLPIQTEVYGEFAHVGKLNITSNSITAEDFSRPEFDINLLI